MNNNFILNPSFVNEVLDDDSEIFDYKIKYLTNELVKKLDKQEVYPSLTELSVHLDNLFNIETNYKYIEVDKIYDYEKNIYKLKKLKYKTSETNILNYKNNIFDYHTKFIAIWKNLYDNISYIKRSVNGYYKINNFDYYYSIDGLVEVSHIEEGYGIIECQVPTTYSVIKIINNIIERGG